MPQTFVAWVGGQRRVALLIGLLLAVCAALACVDTGRRRVEPATGLRPLGWVDVRLATAAPTSVDLGCPTGWELYDAQGRRVTPGGPLARSAAATLRSGSAFLGEVRLGAVPLELRPRGAGLVTVEGKRYRGVLRLEAAGPGELRIVNRLSVEDYLRGVLPGEMPDRFGHEALKAQAVAARSYALAETAERGFLYADVRSQVYGGADVETLLTSQAVAQTACEVLVHGGKVLNAWFHSTCGGATTPARDVFAFAPPGVLRASVVCSDCRESPQYEWTRSMPATDVLAAAGLPSSARLLALECADDPFQGFPGRPVQVRVLASTGERMLTSAELRSRLNSGRPLGEQLLSTRWTRLPRVAGEQVTFEGQGWGHGVGLCQWGARGFASRGANYRTILRRYYPEAELVRLS